MELLEYWKIIRKRLWLILLLLVSSGVTAAYVSEHRQPQYRATTTLFIDPAASTRVLPAQLTSSADSLANTYAEFMRTRSFARLVVEEVGAPLSESEVLKALSNRYVPGTQFFHITALYPDPRVAQALANTAAKVLITQNIARQQARQQQIEEQRNPERELERQRLSQVQEVLRSELAYYDDQITGVQEQIAALQSTAPTTDTNQLILNLRGELVRLLSLRVEVLGNLTQTQLALTTANGTAPDVDTLVVVDEAVLPSSPVPFNTVERVALALASSLLLGVALAFVLEYLDYTVKSPEALDTIYGLPTQSVIGVVDTRGSKGRDGDLVTLTNPRSPATEAFRALRTGVQVAGLASPLRSLLITSARPGEGKTFTAANLAVSVAQNGNRVILVDADLHRPNLHEIFGLAREPGFTNLVIDQQAEADDFLQYSGVENLWVLTCGTLPPHPAELLGSARAAEVMERLEAHADLVIYDSPPATTVTDPLVIASRVDAVLQVVLAGETRIELVRRARTLLERVGARILGPVLNGVERSDWAAYAYQGEYAAGSSGWKAVERPASQRL